MSITINSAARHLCEKSGWKLPGLKLQKLLYLSQMIHIGRTRGERLISASFFATSLGPINLRLQDRLNYFGSAPLSYASLSDIFSDAATLQTQDPHTQTMNDVHDAFSDCSPAELVAITHRENGAWARYYKTGITYAEIPDAALLIEYDQTRNGKFVTTDVRDTMDAVPVMKEASS